MVTDFKLCAKKLVTVNSFEYKNSGGKYSTQKTQYHYMG